MTLAHSDPLVTLYLGDCLDVMAELPAESVDAIVTDPPYGLGFMGKHWDHGVPAREFWAEMYRVAKPGAYLLAFGGTRTIHRIMTNIEDAGWEIRDMLMHIYASGFPKSLNVSKDERFCHCGREAVSQHDVRGVRDTDLPAAVSAQGGEALLLPPMPEQRPRVRRRNRPDATEAEASLWPAKPVVGGRGDVLQDSLRDGGAEYRRDADRGYKGRSFREAVEDSGF